MTEEIEECALWFRRWGLTNYEQFATEEEAAGFAAYLSMESEGEPFGVQFADGRTVKADQWPAFDERLRQWKEGNEREPMEPRPTRQVRDPFTNDVVDVETTAPSWLGLQ